MLWYLLYSFWALLLSCVCVILVIFVSLKEQGFSLEPAITLLLVKDGHTFKMSCVFLVPLNQDNYGVKKV